MMLLDDLDVRRSSPFADSQPVSWRIIFGNYAAHRKSFKAMWSSLQMIQPAGNRSI